MSIMNGELTCGAKCLDATIHVREVHRGSCEWTLLECRFRLLFCVARIVTQNKGKGHSTPSTGTQGLFITAKCERLY